MGDTRFSGGYAIGKYNNFFARTDGAFGIDDTTPDVTNGRLFYSVNTGSTAITYFDVTGNDATNNSGRFQGKIIDVVFLDTVTKLRKSSLMQVSDDTNNFGLRDSIQLMMHNSAWIELSRSSNRIGNALTKTLVSGNTYNLIVNNDTINYVIATTMLGLTIRSISGGYVGQEINIMCNSVGTGNLWVMTDGNIFMSTAQVVIAPTANVLKLVCVSSSPVLWASGPSAVTASGI